MSDDYDLICIGGGSGGIAAARRAASYGARCAVIESQRLGGTCVNVGCVPKKVMWYAAHHAEQLERAADYGFQVSVEGLDWGALVERREAYIRRLNGIYQRNLEHSGVDIVRGHARFVDPHGVEVDGRRLSAERFIVAVGGRPAWPELPGAELGIDSDGFFALGPVKKHNKDSCSSQKCKSRDKYDEFPYYLSIFLFAVCLGHGRFLFL